MVVDELDLDEQSGRDVPVRECSGCTVCCYVAHVPEIRKRSNSLCPKCVARVGCREYRDRPQSCKNFECSWRSGEVGAGLKPDECGVMFERVGRFLVGFTGRTNPRAWAAAAVIDEIKRHLSAGTPVFVLEGGERWNVLLPEGASSVDVVREFKEAVMEKMGWQLPDTPQI